MQSDIQTLLYLFAPKNLLQTFCCVEGKPLYFIKHNLADTFQWGAVYTNIKDKCWQTGAQIDPRWCSRTSFFGLWLDKCPFCCTFFLFLFHSLYFSFLNLVHGINSQSNVCCKGQHLCLSSDWPFAKPWPFVMVRQAVAVNMEPTL